MKTSTRREFLKNSVITGTAISSGLSAARFAHAQGNGIIKIGLIGCGGRGLGAANQALNTGKDVRIVAVGDYFKERAKPEPICYKNNFPNNVILPKTGVSFMFRLQIIIVLITFTVILLIHNRLSAKEPAVLPNTEPLTWNENCTERNNRFVTEFLDKKIGNSVNQRGQYWDRKFDNRKIYENSVAKNRERFRFIIGVRDERKQYESPELCETLETSALLAETVTHKIYAIRWSVFETLNGEGILLEPKNVPSENIQSQNVLPKNKNPKTIIHIPNSDTTPEQIIGLAKIDKINEIINETGFDTAIDGCRIIVPAMVNRDLEKRRFATLTNREYIYRAAFQLGRHIIGYEVQEILALVDWIKKTENTVVRVEGYGEGGLIAFYSAAADTRIDETVVAGYFNNRNKICNEPIDRNVFGLLEQFGDAEIASLIAPRTLIIVNRNAPELKLKSEKNGAPGILVKPENEVVQSEIERAKKLVEPLVTNNVAKPDWIVFEPDEVIKPSGLLLRNTAITLPATNQTAKDYSNRIRLRNQRIIDGMDRHTQHLLEHSVLTRDEFWKKHDTSSPQKYAETIEWYREYFATNIIGRFDDSLVTPKPRTRLYKEEATHTIYEVELDVFDGVIVYGLLLIPKGLTAGEKRPVVVCQHGLEGTPSITLRGGAASYKGMATVLCERGYVTFAPQNLYVLKDKFRFNQRQLNSLGKTLFSIMIPQHQQIINWLGTLEFVDRDKIAFYGKSYGGKTAMRVPPLVNGYCLSICSGDFNYWNLKVASSTLYDFSYIWHGEYEIFDFDLANTYDYSDMAKLIAPRPFMVERGHLDRVGHDEYVGFEFGKVRYFYDHCLKLPNHAEIHWFDGGHIINGEKTYPFLDRFLKNKP
jgi:dienelactone hydrolase